MIKIILQILQLIGVGGFYFIGLLLLKKFIYKQIESKDWKYTLLLSISIMLFSARVIFM